MKTTNALGALLLPLSLLAAAAPADAEEATGDAWSVDAAVTVVSDYKFRGLSLSDKDPALQPEITLSHESGVYAFFWGSTLAENGGADLESDVGIGIARSLGPVDADISATWYLYPGTHGLDYVEFIATLSTRAGPATVGLELGYAPSQSNIGNETNRYAAVNASVPLGDLPITANGSFGVENGAFGDDKLDWSLGLDAEVSGFELGATYVDAAHHGSDPLAAPTVVLSVKKSF